ncbi:MAG: hypothetical protein JXA13_06805 [Anaerolineales bacterium]|nr:hypothetical protein [Anaerolineales bacterium]
MNLRAKVSGLAILFLGILFLLLFYPASKYPVFAQQPTGSVPTVTGTPSGPVATVYQNLGVIKVYAGPSTYIYPPIGVLLPGESAPALGRSVESDDWIQIMYPGVPGSVAWVYAPWISLSPGRLERIPAPPTPTPYSTPTIDPTLEAVFIGQQTPTRLPTFTPPPALEIPSFSGETAAPGGGVPMGLVIFILGFIGGLGALISFLRGR